MFLGFSASLEDACTTANVARLWLVACDAFIHDYWVFLHIRGHCQDGFIPLEPFCQNGVDFVTLLSTVFFGEHLFAIQYIGIAIVLGTLLLYHNWSAVRRNRRLFENPFETKAGKVVMIP